MGTATGGGSLEPGTESGRMRPPVPGVVKAALDDSAVVTKEVTVEKVIANGFSGAENGDIFKASVAPGISVDKLESAVLTEVCRASEGATQGLVKVVSRGVDDTDETIELEENSGVVKSSASLPNLNAESNRTYSEGAGESDDTTDGRDTVTSTSSSSTRSSKRARAKMAARFMSRPLRKSYMGMIAGLGCTVGLGQAVYLKATYQSPPDARGPRCGIERSSPREGEVSVLHTSAPMEPGGPVLQMGAMRATSEGTEEVTAACDGGTELVSGGKKNNPLRKRILIIGDSLVSGVGGLSSFEGGPSDGPALPRQVARFMSNLTELDVQWNAISLTGGDVRLLTRKILPLLAREKEKGTLSEIWGLVIVTGVNDWKRVSPVRTAHRFREDLHAFIDKVREQVGQDCNVFLPAIPGVRHTPRFHEPLRSIVVWLNDYWDSQKLHLSRSMSRVYFVGQPPNHEWGNNPKEFFSELDRVHPSELGYERWGERIAKVMSRVYENSALSSDDANHEDEKLQHTQDIKSPKKKLSARRSSAPDISACGGAGVVPCDS